MFDAVSFFAKATVDGLPLILLILGLVELSKRLGVHGRWLIVLSMAIGTLFGVLYRVSLGVPQDFAGWFAAVCFGLVVGLAACGVFELVDKRMPAVQSVLDALRGGPGDGEVSDDPQ